MISNFAYHIVAKHWVSLFFNITINEHSIKASIEIQLNGWIKSVKSNYKNVYNSVRKFCFKLTLILGISEMIGFFKFYKLYFNGM